MTLATTIRPFAQPRRSRSPRVTPPASAGGLWGMAAITRFASLRALSPFARLRHRRWPGYPSSMRIEVEQEDDQRWIAEVLDLPGVIVYGETRERAVAKAEALALRVIADRLDHGESIPELDDLFVVSA
jgi:predicted RNase H-like HicB family nuclease